MVILCGKCNLEMGEVSLNIYEFEEGREKLNSVINQLMGEIKL